MGITLKILKKYFVKNRLIASLIAYEILTIILLKVTGINVTIPCVYNSLFDVKCPGCGLTKATIFLVDGQFIKSINANPLIIVTIPTLTFLIFKDFRKFIINPT
jgi:hypothetical protein